jgi:hypothetical protein
MPIILIHVKCAANQLTNSLKYGMVETVRRAFPVIRNANLNYVDRVREDNRNGANKTSDMDKELDKKQRKLNHGIPLKKGEPKA